MGAYSPAALAAQIEKVIDAACDAEMKSAGWVRTDGAYHSAQFDGHIPYRGNAVECAGVYIRPYHPVYTPPPASYEVGDGRLYVDPASFLYKPWEERIKAAFEGWDEIPIPEDFQPCVDAASDAVAATTLEPGNDQAGGDPTAGGDLYPNIKYIERWISPSAPGAYTGQTIGAFDYSYGAARQATVIGNQRQAMIAVGLCVTGAKNLWLKAGEDIMNLADNAEVAFSNLTSQSFDLGVVKAFTDVVALFAVGPLKDIASIPGDIVDGAEKVGTLIGVLTPENDAASVDTALSGGSADAVAGKMEDVLRGINDAIWSQEKALLTPLKAVKDDLFGDPRAYHIHPVAGYDPDLRSTEELHVDSFALNKAMGTAIPTIVGTLARAANDIEKAGSSNPWWRPWNIGYGFSGASPELGQLCTLIAEVSRSTGQELLGATQQLAAALGVLDAVDADVDKVLGHLRDDLKGSGLKFPDDPGDPRAERWETLPNGKKIPVGP